MLTVEGHKAENGDHEYLFQGISGRPFRRKFNLADHVEVTGASFEKRAPADRSDAQVAGGHEATPDYDQRRR
jgi:hypothetical protein